MRYPGEQRFIALANFLPIVAGHVRIPIEVALDAPRFAEDLAPLFAGIDLDLQFAEIELAFPHFGLAGGGLDDAVDRAGFVDHFLAFLVEVVAVDAFEQHFVFAFGHLVDVKDALGSAVVGAELPRFLRRGEIEKFVLARGKTIQDAGADGHSRYARADSVQIDLDGFNRLCFLFIFLFVRCLVSGFGVGRLLVVFLVVLFFVFLFVGCFFLVALRLKRGSFIGFQCDCENAVGRIIVETLVELADARIEVAGGNEIKILPAVVEYGIVVAIEAHGNFGDLFGAQGIEEDVVGAAAMGLRIGDPEAVGGPTPVGDVAVVGLVDQDGLLLIQADEPELVHFVPVEKLLAVRRPYRAVAIDSAIRRDARFLPTHLRTGVELVLAGLVRKVGDPLAIGRPGGIQFVNAGMLLGERANAAVFGRNGENVAAGFDESASCRRRERVAADGWRDVFEFRAGFDVFSAHDDGEIAHLAAGEIEFVEQTAVFIDDGVGPEARPLDVVFLVVGELFRLL